MEQRRTAWMRVRSLGWCVRYYWRGAWFTVIWPEDVSFADPTDLKKSDVAGYIIDDVSFSHFEEVDIGLIALDHQKRAHRSVTGRRAPHSKFAAHLKLYKLLISDRLFLTVAILALLLVCMQDIFLKACLFIDWLRSNNFEHRLTSLPRRLLSLWFSEETRTH